MFMFVDYDYDEYLLRCELEDLKEELVDNL
jgi:hypothetical protein